jgi:hypothetical protein
MGDEKDISSLSSEQIDTITINIDDILKDTISIDSSSLNSYVYAPSSSAYTYSTINTGAGYNGSWGATGSVINSSNSGLHVTSNAQFDGDVKIKGVSILETLEKIEKRLSILRPDPEKLAYFESLKKAYEHYKTLEALCELPTKEEE